jgi:hypothetical protein
MMEEKDSKKEHNCAAAAAKAKQRRVRVEGPFTKEMQSDNKKK